MFCFECGKEIFEESKFCRYCGTNQSVKNQETDLPRIPDLSIMETQINHGNLTHEIIANIISESIFEELKDDHDGITKEILYNVFIRAFTTYGNAYFFSCEGISTKNTYNKYSWYEKDIDNVINKMKLNELRYLIIGNLEYGPFNDLGCGFFHEDCKFKEMYWRYSQSGDELYEKIMALQSNEPSIDQNNTDSKRAYTTKVWIEKYIKAPSAIRDVLLDEYSDIQYLINEVDWTDYIWKIGTLYGCVDLIEKKFFAINALGFVISIKDIGGIRFDKELIEERLASGNID